MKLKILKSAEDDSVNFVIKNNYSPGYFEARYVRRDLRKMALYLSSQSGCSQACKMCHLTATKQVDYVNADIEIYLAQAGEVFKHYDENCPKAEMVHFNFMARGEALANPGFLRNGQKLFNLLGEEAMKRDLQARFLVSTIMPRKFSGQNLGKYFPVNGPEIYYSIYSIRDKFRARWLPGAMSVDDALTMLKRYHDDTKKVIRLHWAFIEGENDSKEDVMLICDKLISRNFFAEIRIVRYNPYNQEHGKESPYLQRNVEIIQRYLPFSNVKVISRVGRDVKASCGMFIEPSNS